LFCGGVIIGFSLSNGGRGNQQRGQGIAEHCITVISVLIQSCQVSGSEFKCWIKSFITRSFPSFGHHSRHVGGHSIAIQRGGKAFVRAIRFDQAEKSGKKLFR
jgi:hypothetical protein